MSIARLRAVLQSTLRVSLESTAQVASKVNSLSAERQAALVAGGNAPIPAKNAIPMAQIGSRDWNLRPVDLLHKIGSLTTPSNLNLAKLSASWATRRYFWAIAEPIPPRNKFLLSQDAREMDFHQKTLLSDEFGIGFGGLVLEREFGACNCIDISRALGNPMAYEDIAQDGRTQPDYLMSSAAPNSPYYVVECKGSQTGPSVSYDQMRRGLEQVRSITFGNGARQVVTLVVATCMQQNGTTVFIVDPPSDESDGPEHSGNYEYTSERIGPKSWRVADAEVFAERAWFAQESSLLKWARQYKQAALRDQDLEPWRERRGGLLQSAVLERKATDIGTFVGAWTTAFPELGNSSLRIFTGVEEELFARIEERTERAYREASEIQSHLQRELQGRREHSPFASFSGDGSCMIIDGL